MQNHSSNIPGVAQSVSQVGFGTWQLGGESSFAGRVNGWGPVDEREGIKALQFAFENNINFFDTAEGYGKGKSEEILGKALYPFYKETNPPIICTKFGSVEKGNESFIQDFSKANLFRAVDESLKRLRTEQINIILLHNPPDDFDWKNYDTSPFEELIRQGKIESYGVSCRTIKGASNVINAGFGYVIECIYNPIDRRAEEIVYNHSNVNNFGFISRVPLASGFLTNKTLQQKKPEFADSDIRSTFDPEMVEWLIESANKLNFLDDLTNGITTSCLRFAISHPKVSVVIPGMRKVTQVQDAIIALQEGPLEDEILDRINETLPETFHKWR